MKAACDLVKKFHPKKVYANFIIELVNENFEGRNSFDPDVEVTTLLQLLAAKRLQEILRECSKEAARKL